MLYAMLRYLKPKRLIEVGSGFSSALILDTNDLFLENYISCTFIEPHPDRLYGLLNNNDKNNVTIIDKNLQDVDLEQFKELSDGDVLFIDSSHVSKIDSDVNHILFRVLPILNKGVYIHFHDIFYPFEYCKCFVDQNRAWNECYILRAFLQYNDSFEIVLFNDYINKFYSQTLSEKTPLFPKGGGGSIWLRKI